MDSEWLSKALQDPSTKVLPVWDRKSLVKDGRAVILQYTSVLEQVQREGWTAVPILLGVLSGGQEAVFALDVTDQQAGRYFPPHLVESWCAREARAAFHSAFWKLPSTGASFHNSFRF